MRKTLKTILTGVLCCAMLTSCAGKTTESTVTSDNTSSGAEDTKAEQTVLTPPFWIVEDADTGATLYLLGSMHVGKPNTVYPDYVMDAYEACDKIAAELDTVAANEDLQASIDAMQYIMCPSGTTASDYFGDDYEAVVEFCTEKGLPTSMMDYYVPYYWASSLSVLAAQDGGLYSNYGTETYFLGKAHEDDKEIIEIESAAEQYEMMGSIPMSIQVQSVTDCVGDENYQLQVIGMQALYEAWSTFDDVALETLNADTGAIPEGVDAAEYNEFVDMMYLDRQVTMGEAAVDFLESGDDVFMFVGAAHFYIEEDILTYIENAGYTVNAVSGDEAAAA